MLALCPGSWRLVAASLALTAIIEVNPSLAGMHTLPMPDTTPVISLDYEGGFSVNRLTDEPALLILANGSVTLGSPQGVKKRVTATLSVEELQQLLHFVLDEQQFEAFDEAKVKSAIRATGGGFGIADAATTVIRVNSDERVLEKRFYGLRMAAQLFPQVEALGRLEAVRQRLEHLRSEIYAGGKEGVKAYLQLVNARLDLEHPGLEPFREDHLRDAWQLADGSGNCTFERSEMQDESHMLVVTGRYEYPPNGKPRITVGLETIQTGP